MGDQKEKPDSDDSLSETPLFCSFDDNSDELQPTSSAQPLSSDDLSGFSKYVVFVDESGDHSLQSIDKNYPLFVLAFCVFNKRHYSEKVVPALEKFKFNHFGHDQVILHETEIRKEQGAFNFFRSKDQKNAFLNELTSIIERSNFVLISCVVDKRKFHSRSIDLDNPYHIALGFCLELLYDLLEEKEQHTRLTHVVVEQRGKKEDNALELEFRRLCDGNNRLNKRLPFEIVFSDKRALSSGLQLADLVARPIGLSVLRPNQPNRAFDILKLKFYCEGGRENVGYGYKDFGLKIFPL